MTVLVVTLVLKWFEFALRHWGGWLVGWLNWRFVCDPIAHSSISDLESSIGYFETANFRKESLAENSLNTGV